MRTLVPKPVPDGWYVKVGAGGPFRAHYMRDGSRICQIKMTGTSVPYRGDEFGRCHICRWKLKENPEDHQLLEVEQPANRRGLSMVKIYNFSDDSDRWEIGILTDCVDEQEFCREVGRAVVRSQLATDRRGDSHDALIAQVVQKSADIICRLRGYKNDVHERRLMLAGNAWPSDEMEPLHVRELIEA